MHRISQGCLEVLHVDCEKYTTKYHHPTQCLTRLQIGEGVRDGDHGGKSSTATRGNSP